MSIFDRLKGGRSKGEEETDDVVVDEEVIEDSKPKKSKKGFGLGSLFGRNKQDKSIIDLMGLNEAVASMGLSVLDDIVQSNNPSAVRELNDGYSAIAITEEMLQELEVDVKSADFGSFANAIASENIETLLLEDDLHNGIVTIVPTRDTLDLLDEYSFLEGVIYRWVMIPYDITDDSTVVLLENGASLGDLNVIADDALSLTVKNGEIVTTSSSDVSAEQAFPDDSGVINETAGGFDESDPFADDDDVYGDIFSDEPIESDQTTETPSDIDPDVAFVNDISEFSEQFDDSDDDIDQLDDDLSDFEFEVPMDDLDDEIDEESTVVASNDLSDEIDDMIEDSESLDDSVDELDEFIDSSSDSVDLQSEDEGREMITGALDREFSNDSLGISIDGSVFNQQFGDIQPITFDTTVHDEGLLSEALAEMRRNANTEIKNLHNANMQKLRSMYQLGMSDTHDKLYEVLDHRNPETSFGSAYVELENERNDQLDRADELIARSREALDQSYHQERDEYGERAKREALSKYDDLNKKEHDNRKRELGEEVESNIELEFDSDLATLYTERRDFAKQIFDKMTTEVMMELQDVHEKNMMQEKELYESLHERMDKYVKENYENETLRAKALATQQRQHHEADEVRAQYEQMLATKQSELEAMREKSDAEIRRLEDSSSRAIQESVKEYKRQVEKREEQIDELNKNSERLNDRIVTIAQEKDKEYESLIESKNKTIEARDEDLRREQNRSDKQGRQSMVLYAGAVIVGVALGIIVGFVISSNRSTPTPVPAPANTVFVMDYVDTSAIEQAYEQAFHTMFLK